MFSRQLKIYLFVMRASIFSKFNVKTVANQSKPASKNFFRQVFFWRFLHQFLDRKRHSNTISYILIHNKTHRQCSNVNMNGLECLRVPLWVLHCISNESEASPRECVTEKQENIMNSRGYYSIRKCFQIFVSP